MIKLKHWVRNWNGVPGQRAAMRTNEGNANAGKPGFARTIFESTGQKGKL